jgi:FkbM family methyltransferase
MREFRERRRHKTATDAATSRLLDSFTPNERARVEVVRSTTTPPFLIALTPQGHNADFLNVHFRDGTYHNGHEPVTAAFAQQLNGTCGRQPLCAIDAGMNAGFYALLAAAFGCRTRAFEVQPDLVRLGRASAALNGFDESRLSISHAALGRERGSARPMGGGGGSARMRVSDGAPGAVPIVALDDVVEGACGGQCELLKLDVEGFELFALAGLARSVRERRVKHILFEFGGASRWEAHSQSAADGVRALQTLHDSGYELRLMKMLTAAPPARARWAVGRVGERHSYWVVPRHELSELVLPRHDVNIWAALVNQSTAT